MSSSSSSSSSTTTSTKINFSDFDIALFDLDETLIRSDHVWDMVGEIWIKRHGLPTVTPQQLVDHGWSESVGFFDGAQIVMNALGLKEPEYTAKAVGKEWIKIGEECYVDPNEVPLIAGARDFLEALRSAGVKMAVVTSNCVDLTEKVLAVHGIGEFFSVIVTSDMAERPKPFPDPYIMALRKLGVSGDDFSRVVVFEDSMQNGKSVMGTGMKVCGIYSAVKSAVKKWPEYSKAANFVVKETYDEINPNK